jgi:hypothetical protein
MQVLLHAVACFLMPEQALDPCVALNPQTAGTNWFEKGQGPAMWLLCWVFGTEGGPMSCPIVMRWVQWYALFYLVAFHYGRKFAAFAKGRLPHSRGWGWVALAGSLFIGIAMASFHYPNTVLETGEGLQNAPLEFAIDMMQPLLLALAMVHCPFNLRWWGNTTLGTYCFHFYFLDTMAGWAQVNLPAIGRVDPSGVLCVVYVIGTAVVFTTFLGPLGHYVLISPTILGGKVLLWRRRRREA